MLTGEATALSTLFREVIQQTAVFSLMLTVMLEVLLDMNTTLLTQAAPSSYGTALRAREVSLIIPVLTCPQT